MSTTTTTDFDTAELKHWADVRNTDEAVAAAIANVCSMDRAEMDRVWQDPTRDEALAVAKLAGGGDVPADDLQWGERTLADVAGQ